MIGAADVNMAGIFVSDSESVQILLESRLPRLISIIAAGIGMSIAGLIMQQLSRNKFVSPTTAATEDSAKLVSMILFPGAGTFKTMIISFVFAVGGTFLFMKILKGIKFKNIIYVPLIGIMLGNIIDSVSVFLSYRYDVVQSVASWLMGDFSMIIKGRYELLYISIPLMVIATSE